MNQKCFIAWTRISLTYQFIIRNANKSHTYRNGTSIREAPVFRHLRALRKSPWSLLSGWMNYNYTACCWFPTSSNILILPSQFWQIGFESCWLYCSKCRILVFLRYNVLYRSSLMQLKEIQWMSGPTSTSRESQGAVAQNVLSSKAPSAPRMSQTRR